MNTKTIRVLSLILLASFSMAAHSDGCDFEGHIPNKWIQMKDVTIASIVIRSNSVCLAIKDSFIQQGRTKHAKELKCDTEWEDFELSKLHQTNDQLHWFNNFKFCPNGGERALDGYVFVRDGKQVAFELKVGIHNKALQSTASGGD